MYLWLKIFHIAAMSVWFTGLFLLPRLLVARSAGQGDGDAEFFGPMARTLYFGILTPAGVATVAIGIGLIGYGPYGGWLAIKLAVVAIAVLIHLYLGVLVQESLQQRSRHGVGFLRLLGWTPLLLLAAIAAITAGKPEIAVPPPPSLGVIEVAHSRGEESDSPGTSASSRP